MLLFQAVAITFSAKQRRFWKRKKLQSGLHLIHRATIILLAAAGPSNHVIGQVGRMTAAFIQGLPLGLSVRMSPSNESSTFFVLRHLSAGIHQAEEKGVRNHHASLPHAEGHSEVSEQRVRPIRPHAREDLSIHYGWLR